MNFGVVFLISLVLILVVILAMSVGVLFGRRPISGSCGGLNQAGGCVLCSGNCPKRESQTDQIQE